MILVKIYFALLGLTTVVAVFRRKYREYTPWAALYLAKKNNDGWFQVILEGIRVWCANNWLALDRLLAAVIGLSGERTISAWLGKRMHTDTGCRVCRWICGLLTWIEGGPRNGLGHCERAYRSSQEERDAEERDAWS